jgi:hypothetical protein
LIWIATDDEISEERLVEEPRTLKELRRCVGISIARWLLSGIDCPDYEATDGVSEQEVNMELFYES